MTAQNRLPSDPDHKKAFTKKLGKLARSEREKNACSYKNALVYQCK